MISMFVANNLHQFGLHIYSFVLQSGIEPLRLSFSYPFQLITSRFWFTWTKSQHTNLPWLYTYLYIEPTYNRMELKSNIVTNFRGWCDLNHLLSCGTGFGEWNKRQNIRIHYTHTHINIYIYLYTKSKRSRNKSPYTSAFFHEYLIFSEQWIIFISKYLKPCIGFVRLTTHKNNRNQCSEYTANYFENQNQPGSAGFFFYPQL